MFPTEIVHPVGFQQGRSDIDITQLFRYQFPAQRNDFRQIHIIKDSLSVSDTLETGIQPTTHIHHDRIWMRFDKLLYGTVKIPSSHHTSHFTQFCSIKLGIIIFQIVRQLFRSLVIPLDLRNKRKYGWNDYFCCVKETDQPTAR